MLNTQTPLKQEHDRHGELAVHSIFPTIQGEGPFAGHPAVFVRLFGCNLQCPGCDTEYTSVRDMMMPLRVVNEVRGHELSLVVITGGEPFRQNITPLVEALTTAGFYVQIESNGVFNAPTGFDWAHPLVTVVVSPKTAKIHPVTAARADVYKYVLSARDVAEDGLPVSALSHPLPEGKTVARPPLGWCGSIYLNPMDEQHPRLNEENMEAVTDSVLTGRGAYIMGIQMHKIVGLP